MNRIIAPLKQMGIEIVTLQEETAPLLLNTRSQGTFLQPLNYTLPMASAQVKTCLLLAGLGAQGKTTLHEPGPSRDHSERMLSSMGVKLMSWEERSANGAEFVVEMNTSVGQNLTPLQMHIPGDPSAAAFLIVAALISPSSQLTLRNVCLNPTRVGFLEALISMGAAITYTNEHSIAGEPIGDIMVNSSMLHGTTINGPLVVRMIDEFPIFAIAAALAEGTTTVQEAAELRLKESDRISTLACELCSLGVKIDEQPDGFTIRGGKILGGNVTAHSDHRLAMSLAVAGLAAESTVTVEDAECISESYPGFVHSLARLGAKIQIEEDK
jgi:3-phosphoshikimate 1-carboxyvinyltransferase